MLLNNNTVNPVLRGHFWKKDKVVLLRDSIHIQYYMTGQEVGDHLIQVTV